MRDLYETLGVSRDASAADVKKAYRELTRKHHPDKNPGDKAAEERFKDVSGAYDVLGDADKRTLYDEFGEASLTQGFDVKRARAYKSARQGFGGGFDPGGSGSYFHNFGEARETSFDDLLSRLFGGGKVGGADELFRQARPVDRRGSDIAGEINVRFLEALAGTTVPLRIEATDGAIRTLDVKVPQGITDGAKLRLRGQGGRGKPHGDVLLTIRVGSHNRMRRDGDNLRLEVPVTALEAYRGGPIEVRTPWGPVMVKLRPGSQNGQVLRLRGKGVQQKGKPPGDLLVTLDVRLPAAGNKRLLEALEAAQADENVRADLAL